MELKFIYSFSTTDTSHLLELLFAGVPKAYMTTPTGRRDIVLMV
jgi:hypothetical protein